MRAVDGWNGRIALRERANISLLARARVAKARAGLLHGLIGGHSRGGVHPPVDMGPVRVRRAPQAYRAARVQARCLVERPDGLAVIEAVQQAHALVEVSLRERHAGGDGDVVVAQVRIQRDRVLRPAAQRGQRDERHKHSDLRLAEAAQSVDVVLREPAPAVPLFLPRIAPHVITILLPEPGHIHVQQRKSPDPFRALPQV